MTETHAPLTVAELDAIRERAEAATSGPWEVSIYAAEPTDAGKELAASSDQEFMQSGRWLQRTVIRTRWIHGQSHEKVPLPQDAFTPYAKPEHFHHWRDEDAAFIAAARTDIPALLATVDALREGLLKIAALGDTTRADSTAVIRVNNAGRVARALLGEPSEPAT
jgi:hypothetical protein